MNEILSITENGKVFLCPRCKLIHFEFKNLSFNFTETEFDYFRDYFEKINGEFWEVINANTFFKRKIFIPIGVENFKIILNKTEVSEINKLLVCGSTEVKQNSRFNFPFSNN